jgi:hypothetical protein
MKSFRLNRPEYGEFRLNSHLAISGVRYKKTMVYVLTAGEDD